MKLFSRYNCNHKYWKDHMYIDWDQKKFNRIKILSDVGTIKIKENKLHLNWKKWGEEILKYNEITHQFNNKILVLTPIIQFNKIPKLIHQIWIGPKTKPEFLMNTFIKIHNAKVINDPSEYKDDNKWYYMNWDETMIHKLIDLKNKHQYNKQIDFAGKSDIARYEILYKYGGIYMDADCICIKSIPDNFLDYDFFSVYENEKRRPGLIANGIMGSLKNSIILENCISTITPIKKIKPSCKYLGPHLLTNIINRNKNLNICIHPSYIFLPLWLNPKIEYTKYPNVLNDAKFNTQIICNHLWTTTKNKFNEDIYKHFFYENYPGISVLMPVYNEQINIFKKCVDSIFNQNFKYIIELVIINDGSNKEIYDYLNTLHKCKNQYLIIKIINLDENKGINNALKIGILECKYELIARMDSDDIMYPNRLKKQYNYFQNNKVDVLGTAIHMFYDNGKKSKNILHPRVIDINFVKTNKSLWFLNHPTVMFKKSIVLDSGNYLDNDIPEDFDLWIRILKKGYIIHNLKDICLKYRRNSNNLSKSLSREIVNKMTQLIKSI